MLIKEWEDAMDAVWLPPENVEAVADPAEKFLLGQFHLAYLYGKGKKFVPVLIPKDIVNVVQILIDNRQVHGIRSDNHFLFASKQSSSHCSGWHAVQQVAKAANASVNATRNRHRISTIYASLDMSKEDQRVFMDHMGHDAAINADNYQCPLGVKEVRVMGKVLRQIDQNTGIPSNQPFPLNEPRKRRPVIIETDEEDEDESDTSVPVQKRKRTDVSVVDDEDAQDMIDTGIPTNQPYPLNKPRKRRPVIIDTDEDESDTSVPVQKRKRTDVSVVDDEDAQDMIENPRNIRKRHTVFWTDADTEKVRRYFVSFFDESLTDSHNKGKLPSKSDILEFLKDETPECLSGLDINAAYKKTRAKLFNDRKTKRETMRKNLKGLC